MAEGALLFPKLRLESARKTLQHMVHLRHGLALLNGDKLKGMVC